jgi:hypothetical protein
MSRTYSFNPYELRPSKHDADWKDRNVCVYRDTELDVRWDTVTDRIILHDTLGDELIIMQSKTIEEIVETLSIMKSSAL